MPKVAVEIVADVMAKKHFESEVIEETIKEIERKASIVAEQERAAREPSVKKQFVIVISDPRGSLPKNEDFVGWVTQVPEDDSPSVAIERIIRAAYEYNVSKKGSRHPVNSIGESCEAVGPRFLKEQGVVVKTKLPITVLSTDNVLPRIG